MKHKREEIIRFVEKRISGDKKFRRLTPLMGLAFIGCSFAFFKMVIENEHTATLPFLMGFMIERDSIRPIDETVKQRKIKAYEKSCPSEMSEDCKKLLQLCGADQA